MSATKKSSVPKGRVKGKTVKKDKISGHLPEVEDKEKDGIHGITVPAIKRILRRAGVRRITQAIYEIIRLEAITPLLNEILENAMIFMEHNKRKTVQVGDLKGALNLMGLHLGAGLNQNTTTTFHSSVGFGHKKNVKSTKTRKFKPGTVAAREIRREQKNSDRFAIPKANFGRLAREYISNMTAEDIRFSKGVLALVQLSVENIVVSLCKDAYLLSLHAGRETLMTSDLRLILRIKNHQ